LNNKNEATASRLREVKVDSISCVDRHWDRLQPELAAMLKMGVTPSRGTKDAWHFGRHNFTAHGISGWDLVTATTLSAGTECQIERKRVVFREGKAR
jgi:hypothetical protein